MLQTQYRLITENTLGDGNCAFNAFALGLCNQDVLDKIENQLIKQNKDPNKVFQIFIAKMATVLKLEANWSIVKQALIELRHQDKEKLQRKLAPILREIAIDKALKDSRHSSETFPSLAGTFRNYVYEREGLFLAGESDDIYHRHKFIFSKFAELYEAYLKNNFNDLHIKKHFEISKREYNKLARKKKSTREETRKLIQFDQKMDELIKPIQNKFLQPWWGKQGYCLFLHSMKKTGKWAGDLELKQLGHCFGVHVDIFRDGFTHRMHWAHGTILRHSHEYGYALQKTEVKQLVIRHVVDKPTNKKQKQFSLLPLAPAELSMRLAAVPEYEKVQVFIKTHKHDLKKQLVPHDWSNECVHELIQRDMVDKTKRCFIVQSVEAEKRIPALKCKEKLETVWRNSYQDSPVVTLSNAHAAHWSNLNLSKVAAKPKHYSSYEDSPLYKETFFTNFSMWAEKKSDEKSWDQLVKEVNDTDGKISYTIPDPEKPEGKIIKISEEEQIKLDLALAKKIQLEEYRKFKP